MFDLDVVIRPRHAQPGGPLQRPLTVCIELADHDFQIGRGHGLPPWGAVVTADHDTRCGGDRKYLVSRSQALPGNALPGRLRLPSSNWAEHSPSARYGEAEP